MEVLDKLFKKYSYKFDKGYPDINNEQDILLLENILNGLNLNIDKGEFGEVDLPKDILYENLVLLPLRNKVFLVSGELSDQTVNYDTGLRKFIQLFVLNLRVLIQ